MLKDLSCTFVVGINDQILCGEGWYERTVDGRFGMMHRPAGPRAVFHLDLPPGRNEISALMSASASLCNGGTMRGQLLMDDLPVGRFTLDTDDWVLRRFLLPESPGGRVKFHWITDNPFIPHTRLQNGDFRPIGPYVAAARVSQANNGAQQP